MVATDVTSQPAGGDLPCDGPRDAPLTVVLAHGADAPRCSPRPAAANRAASDRTEADRTEADRTEADRTEADRTEADRAEAPGAVAVCPAGRPVPA